MEVVILAEAEDFSGEDHEAVVLRVEDHEGAVPSSAVAVNKPATP